MGLDLNLTPQLVLHVGLLQLGLEEDLAKEGGRDRPLASEPLPLSTIENMVFFRSCFILLQEPLSP